MPDDPEVQDERLCVNGKVYDPVDDLTYAERRAVKRIVRLELWDEEVDGPWVDWQEPSTDDYVAATVLVLMRRDDPGATLEQVLAQKPGDVVRPVEDPPTKPAPASAKRSRAKTKTSATSGSQS